MKRSISLYRIKINDDGRGSEEYTTKECAKKIAGATYQMMGVNIVDIDKITKIHAEIGMVLSNVSGSRDIQVIRRLQDNLSDKLATGSVRSLHDLYEAILEITK